MVLVTSACDLLGWLDHPSPVAGLHSADPAGRFERVTYQQLAVEVRRVAAGLAANGVRPGDRVVVVLPSGPKFAACFFGVATAGAIPVPVAPPQAYQDPRVYRRHLDVVLATAGPTMAIWSGTDTEGIGRLDGGPLVGPRRVPDRTGAGAGAGADLLWMTMDEVAAGGGGRHDPIVRTDDDPALLQFTSGSSGVAKGVLISRGALAANVGAIGRWLGFGPGRSVVSWLPVHHDMGLVGCLVAPICHQMPVWTMPPEQFVAHPERWLQCVADQGAVLSAMPAFGLAHLLRRVPGDIWDRLDLSALQGVVLGAERCDAAVLASAAARLALCGARRGVLLPAYGLAEATLAVTGVAPGEELRTESGPRGVSVVGCGRPLDSVTVEVHTSDGRQAGPGEVGEIVVSGPAVADGYCVAPGASPAGEHGLTTTAIHDGWLHTGDAGFLRHGWLYVVGRFGDSVKVRGRPVFAEDLEMALAGAGMGAGRVAVTLGEDGGRPQAVVVVENVDAEIRSTVRTVVGRSVPDLAVVVVGVERGGIPRTSSGKPRRRQLWEAFGEMR